MQNQKISELYTDDNKSKHFSNPKDIFKSAKKFYQKLCTKEDPSKAPSTEFFSKFSNRKEMSNEPFEVCEAEIYSNEAIKSYKSHTNNKSPGTDFLTAEFYKHS